MSELLHDIDLASFWEPNTHGDSHDQPPDDQLIAELEQALGYRLPASYIAFMKRHNGGRPQLSCFPTEEFTSWAEDHCAIDSFLSIGRRQPSSLGGEFGSRFMIEEWGYPDLGVYICDCPSAGHDMIALDYRECGPQGEPQVVHVDQEGDYRVTFLARNFETFVRGLVSPEVYDTSEQDYLDDRLKACEAPFSEVLSELLRPFDGLPDPGAAIRRVALQIVEQKRYFALHADPLSYLLYDLQFWLYQSRHPLQTQEQYLAIYSEMIAFGKGFGTGGYAPGFITDWWAARVEGGQLQQGDGGFSLTQAHLNHVLEQLDQVPGDTDLNKDPS